MSDTNDMRPEFEAWELKHHDQIGFWPSCFDAYQAATERATAIERERCAALCKNERYPSTANDIDTGYNHAIDDCVEAKIITFGTIEQNDNGTLCFSDFHIDAANEFNNDVVAILTLVIRRLQSELDKELAKPKPADVYPATPR